MLNVVGICNLAVSRLGESPNIASIDPPEGSALAEHCALFYPLARDTLLEAFPWNFATYRTNLALLNETIGAWRFAYARPSDTIKIIAVLPLSTGKNEVTAEYEVSRNTAGDIVILTDEQYATIKYTSRVDDPQKYSPLFVDALSWLLASYIAGPVLKGDAGAAMAKICYQSFMLVMSQARNSDAGQKSIKQEHSADWMRARG